MTAGVLALSRVHFPVSALGPGQRVGIWFQGCSRRCAGCISPDTWDFRQPSLPVSTLVHSLDDWLRQCDGITITGGEPLDQPGALTALVRMLKEQYAKNILLFTGRTFQAARRLLAGAAPCVDAAVCGPYDETASQTLALRGSDNQTLHCLTPAGEVAFASYERAATLRDKKLDLMFDADGSVWFAGIPGRGDMDRLAGLLAARGSALEACR
jgi:anaerobic ribonucleoside-triphosphate reductase activating protein